MTSTHASRPLLVSLPSSLNSLYFPPATKPEAFVLGKPVKGRNEPSAIGGVGWVVSQLHDSVSFEALTERVWKNTVQLFALDELKEE